jgi:hypothetical protein
MGMMASGAHALPNESNIHYGSHTSSSSEWNITDRDGWDLDISDIEEILWAKIHYQSEVKNQQTSGYDTFIKMPHAPKYQINLTDQQQETIQGDIHQFRESISRELRHDLSSQAQSDALNLEGFAKFASIFKAPTTKQHIDTQTINIVGSASFDWDHAKNTILATNRAQYIHDLLSKNNRKNIALSTDISEAAQLTDAEQSRLEAYAMQTKKTTKSLIREHNLGKSFSWEIDTFLSQHLEEKQGVHVSSDVHFTRTITQDISLSAYWLVLAWLGITFRKKLKNASRSLAQNMGRLKIWGQKIFSWNWSAHDARERLRENLEEIRWEVDDPRINTDDFARTNQKEIIYEKEPSKTRTEKLVNILRSMFFMKKNTSEDTTPLSSDTSKQRLKELITEETPPISDEIPTPQESTAPDEPQHVPIKIQEPYRQERWRPNARRAISAFDTILEKHTHSNNIQLSAIDIETLRGLMKKEAWDTLEYEIRTILRHIRNSSISYKNTDANELLEELAHFADDIAGRERFGRWHIGHTMSPYFVQKDTNSMRSDSTAERMKSISQFVPTTKVDIGNGNHIYLSNRVRAADGAENNHIAIYALHEGKLTGYIFEESRTTWEWKLVPSKQWKNGNTLEQITTQQNTHITKSLGSLTIHTLNSDIISEVFKQPLVWKMPRNEIRHIFHTPNSAMETMAKAA